MTPTDALGWSSSLLLLVTIIAQIRKQWATRSARGVSRWLFVGQAGASAGFTAYSALVENWVFTVTNAALFVAAMVGMALTLSGRSERQRGDQDDGAPAGAPAERV